MLSRVKAEAKAKGEKRFGEFDRMDGQFMELGTTAIKLGRTRDLGSPKLPDSFSGAAGDWPIYERLIA